MQNFYGLFWILHILSERLHALSNEDFYSHIIDEKEQKESRQVDQTMMELYNAL
ncbi:hypothetical protein JCM12214_25370 [Geobacillus vulcani]|uniref:Uncharacterized protein n=1 Tax=Geobacillus thermopakistaniensis (strain MAS1) TaxID=1408282 RepID=A0A7U9J950_GEOTM|nr:hypothetical protein T260_14290 [Geobacillus sp. MAS1]